MTIDILQQLDTALGPVAVMSLQRRGLIAPVGTSPPSALSGSSGPAEVDALRDRIFGALLGAAVANHVGRVARRLPRDAAGFVNRDALDAWTAGPRDRTGPETRQLRYSIEAGLRGGWSQPEVLADAIFRSADQFRRSAAITATAQRRHAGAPWFEAGVPSHGNGALIRAVGSGVLYADDRIAAPVMASIDAAVTHASPAATDAASVLAAAIAALVTRPLGADPDGLLCGSVETARHATVRAALDQAIALGGLHHREALPILGLGPLAATTLAAAWWILLANPGDAAGAIATAASVPSEGPVIAAIVGALAGAAYGASALPAGWVAGVDRNGRLGSLADRVLARLGVVAPRPGTGAGTRGFFGRGPSTADSPTAGSDSEQGADIWFLLDRSGSMQSIAGDVVGGFNAYFAEQQAEPGDATVSIIQFDSGDPEEVMLDRVPLSQVRPIGAHEFQPRGCTPLFDAIGLLIDRAERAGGHAADQLVVVLTDGAENASSRWSRTELFGRIEALTERGWTFVFLGANQDSYASGGELGVAAGNISNFAASPDSVHAVFSGASRSSRDWRSKSRAQRSADSRDFWGGRKEGEDLP